MSTSGIVGEEIGRQAALASVALQGISGTGANAGHFLPRAVLAMLGPYSAAKFFAERVLQSGAFDAELVQALYSKLFPLERMVDDVLTAARQRGRFDDPDAAEPLRWLETCNEQVKDCMVALESMLDPQLDDLMSAAMEEHQRGETVPLDSIF
jgi:dihydrodipicolinate synthase/N-acetylneuraminate lyase